MTRPWLSRARPLMGKLSDHEIARRFSVARTVISKARRGLGIATAPRSDDRSWVAGVRHLLGKLPDREVGKRVGRSTDLVGEARRELGIARKQRRPQIRGTGKVPLTIALLRSSRSHAEIARMTGVVAGTVGHRRRAMGIRPPPRPEPRWHAKARPMLGKRTDVEVGRLVGASSDRVAALRRRLGIAAAVPVSRMLRARIPVTALRRVRRALSGPDRVIFDDRLMARPPRSLAAIGREIGMSKQAVAEREKRILARLG